MISAQYGYCVGTKPTPTKTKTKTTMKTNKATTKNSQPYIRPTRRVIRALRSLKRANYVTLAKAANLDTDGVRDAVKRLVKRGRVTATKISVALAA